MVLCRLCDRGSAWSFSGLSCVLETAETAVDSTTWSLLPPLSEEARFSILSYSETISGQRSYFHLSSSLVSRGASRARGEGPGAWAVHPAVQLQALLPSASPKAEKSEVSSGISAKAVGVFKPRRALVEADERKHLLTCHYEGSPRRGRCKPRGAFDSLQLRRKETRILSLRSRRSGPDRWPS